MIPPQSTLGSKLRERPLVFGHRGASAYAPENTLVAFQLAIEQGADGIELDARLSRDGEVMVLHDSRVDRVTEGSGTLSSLKRGDIQRLLFNPQMGGLAVGQHIPALEEVFGTFGGRILYDLEIKNFSASNNVLENKVLGLIRRYHLEESVLITSFNPWSVRFFQHKLPQAPAGLLLLGSAVGRVEDFLTAHWAAQGLVGLDHTGLRPNVPTRFPGRSVLVWGVRTSDDVCRAVKLGICGVVADDPGMARRALANE